MNHLIVAEIQALINNDVANVNLGDVSECNISILFWSSLLMLILYIDHILYGRLSLYPEFVIGPSKDRNKSLNWTWHSNNVYLLDIMECWLATTEFTFY